MEPVKSRVLALAMLVLAPGVSFGGAGDGLANTDHDFTTNADVVVTGGGSSIGLCTFCHTPHKAKSTQLLWNHTLSSNTFDYGVTATTAGTTYSKIKGDTYKGPSAKCLSCHDGSVAIGDVGWFKEGANSGASALSTTKMGDADPSGAHTVGPGGDISGNHPIAMPYPLNNAANTYNGITNGARLVTAEWQADPTANNIRLYSDDGSGNIVGVKKAGATGIECSSCHDPHNKAAKDEMFLRGMMTGGTQASGYLCLQCHVK